MLFIETIRKIITLINEQDKVIETDEFFIGYKNPISGSRTIINDIFLLCSKLNNHDLLIQNTKISQYAWNSAPNDNTNVISRGAAVGQEFRFNMDTELLLTPTLNPNKNQALFKYLLYASTNSQFTISILEILI